MSASPHRALRGRLVLTYVAVLAAGLIVFSIAAVAVIDHTARSSLDSRLATAAKLAASVIDVRDDGLAADAGDRGQFATLMGTDMEGAALNRDGSIVASNANPPAEVLAEIEGGTAPRFASVAGIGGDLRVYVAPILDRGVRAGTIVLWRGSDYIDELDRDAIVAFGIATLAIVLLAYFVGGAVTNRALADAFARQRRFTADASHELRAPLSVIRAEADLALRRERSGVQYRDALASIASEADRIEALIDGLLAAARAESGSLRTDAVDLREICVRICDRISPAAAAKSVALRLEGSPAKIVGDESALERALLAVVHNAVKYAPRGGRVDVHVGTRNGSAEAVVRDSGPGFSDAALEHAFERFWRDDLARGQEGTGLGLAIARSIAEAFGGRIEIRNAAGGGAEVHASFISA